MQRFWDKVDATGNCWEWTAERTSNGYGRFRSNSKSYRAHRYAWQILVGPIPNGLVIDHLCRNPLCVNPDHLEVVTQAENVRRGHAGSNNRVKTHCPAGHEYNDTNTTVSGNQRYCRVCKRENMRRYRQAQAPR